MPTALSQARTILDNPALFAHRPSLRRLAALIVLSAEGQTPRQIGGQA